MAGFNIIVFATIAVLAHREKIRKKRNGQLEVEVSCVESAVAPSGKVLQVQDDQHERGGGKKASGLKVVEL